MNRYTCPACGQDQFSATDTLTDEPCIFCGHAGVVLQPTLPREPLLLTLPHTFLICNEFRQEAPDGR